METVRVHLSRHVVGYLALFVALGGTSYGVATGSIDSREIKNGSVRSKDLRNNDVRARDIRNSTIGTADVANGSLLASDFATGQLPRGPQGPSGERGPRGPSGEGGPQGPSGATNVTVRTSGQGIVGSGAPAAGLNGGTGGAASCTQAGCVLARGGAGGNGAPPTGSGGFGGNATCGEIAGCSALGGAGGGTGSTLGAQPGHGARVGLRALCSPGERAVGGGVRASDRDAVVYRNHPSTATAVAPEAGATPTAWYVEAYNQSRVGENRAGINDLTVQAYVVCARP